MTELLAAERVATGSEPGPLRYGNSSPKAAADRPFVPEGRLVPRFCYDGAGRRIISYYRDPKTWMSQFAGFRGSVHSFTPPT